MSHGKKYTYHDSILNTEEDIKRHKELALETYKTLKCF